MITTRKKSNAKKNILNIAKIMTIAVLSMVGYNTANAQLKVGENESTIQPSSLVELESTSKGLLLPRMTTTQRDAISSNGSFVSSKSHGLLIYNTTEGCVNWWNNELNSWISPCSNTDSLTNDHDYYVYVRTSNNRTDSIPMDITKDLWTQGTVVWGAQSNSASGSNAATWGINNTLSGNNSAAWGNNNTVTSTNSFATGINDTVSGHHSAVWGTANNVSSLNSAAWGTQNKVSADQSTAMGSKNTVTGPHSAVWGSLNVVSGSQVGVTGVQNTVNASRSFVAGNANTVDNALNSDIADAFVGGNSNVVKVDNAVVVGLQNYVEGENLAVFGAYNSGSGVQGGIIAGIQDTVTGNYSAAWGNTNRISGDNSAAWGATNTVSGLNSTAYGSSNSSTGFNAAVWGTANKNEGNESLVLGNSNYNKSTRGITAGILNYSGDGSGNFVSGYSDTIFDGVSNSINIGQQNVISGTANQAAFGSNNRLEGHSNITWGAYNKILNGSGGLSYSNAIGGQGNILTDSSTYNHVVGRSNYVSRNEYAEVCGYIDTAISATSIFMSGTLNYLNGGSYSAVWGYSNRITGTSSAVFGLSNNVSGKQSAVWGTNNTLSGNNSSVIAGTGLTGAANNTAYADKIVINSGTVGGAAITSDRRLKTNIVANPYGLETVMQLRPVEYDKKAKLASNEYDRHEMGFIAQEIKEIIPQIVDSATNAYNEQILAVDYNSLIPVLTKAIQELKAENDALKEELENTNEASAAKVTSLEAQLALIQVALQAKGIEVSTAEVTVKD